MAGSIFLKVVRMGLRNDKRAKAPETVYGCAGGGKL
jgi:hypothetical protein